MDPPNVDKHGGQQAPRLARQRERSVVRPPENELLSRRLVPRPEVQHHEEKNRQLDKDQADRDSGDVA
jgi:hypothetical protein